MLPELFRIRSGEREAFFASLNSNYLLSERQLLQGILRVGQPALERGR